MLVLHLLRLMRFGNLMVMGITMCIIQAFVKAHSNEAELRANELGDYLLTTELKDGNTLSRLICELKLDYGIDWHFILLILSVVLIAGAGNIINDYYDVKTDKVNKPEKLVIDKHIKKEKAFVLGMVFNIIGLFLAIYLSLQNENWWITLIAACTILFLWSYSALYKRKLFVGNILIAVLIGIVPIYVLIYNLPLERFGVPFTPAPKIEYLDFGTFFVIKVIGIVAAIAFLINLMREIIKDMADVKGDLHLEAKTVPIALGFRTTKIIITLIFIPLLALMAYYVLEIHYLQDFFDIHAPAGLVDNDGNKVVLFDRLHYFALSVFAAAAICIISFIILITSHRRKRYLLASNVLKLAMLFGMVSPLFL